MKALTLTQPWAMLVAIGAKTIETRDWNTSYRGRFALHAAKAFPDDARYFVTEEPFASALGNLRPAQLPTGAIIGVATIAQTWQFTESAVEKIRERSAKHELPPFEADFGNYKVGRYGFRLADVVMLPTPVPARGMLNLWSVPADVENEVLKQLKAKDERQMEDSAGHMVAAFKAIEDTKLDRGEVPCPKCGGKMAFAHASNGHIRATCERSGCLAFMS